jgi:transcriptional/translational regulatory protein YebC/TACO1
LSYNNPLKIAFANADIETGQKVLKLLDALDEHDDVQNVYSNLNVTDVMMT